MTRQLSQQVREQLQAADASPLWEVHDLGRVRMQVEALRDAYPMSDIRLAQFLIETAMGIEDVLAKPDADLRKELTGYQVGLALLASAVSRRMRGKPEV